MSEKSTNVGCLPLILNILTFYSLWFGLPTPWGVLNIDLIPPAIRIVNPE